MALLEPATQAVHSCYRDEKSVPRMACWYFFSLFLRFLLSPLVFSATNPASDPATDPATNPVNLIHFNTTPRLPTLAGYFVTVNGDAATITLYTVSQSGKK
jgi:hypothetical protein